MKHFQMLSVLMLRGAAFGFEKRLTERTYYTMEHHQGLKN